MTRVVAWAVLWGTAVVVSPGCSQFNREGPDVTCGDLDSGATNACREGIIARCPDGERVTYEVCEEETICEEPWQDPGLFRCVQGGGEAAIRVFEVKLSNPGGTGFGPDGLLGPGDSGFVAIGAKNTGTADAWGVVASLSEIDADVSLSGCWAWDKEPQPVDCGLACQCDAVSDGQSIPNKNSVMSILAVEFQVAPTAPIQPLRFGVVFRDKQGKDWPDSFELGLQVP